MPEDDQVYNLTYEEMNLYHRLINEKYLALFQHDYIPQSADEWTARHVVRKITQPTIEEDDDNNEAAKKKEKMIVEIIAWNLDQNRFDHDTGEEDMIRWIIETHKLLEGMMPETLRTLQHANSLADKVEEETKKRLVLRLTVSYTVLPNGYDEKPLRLAVERNLGARWRSTNNHGYVEFLLSESLTDDQQAWLMQAKEQKRFIGWLVQTEG